MAADRYIVARELAEQAVTNATPGTEHHVLGQTVLELLRLRDQGVQLTDDRWAAELAETRDGIADLARRVPSIAAHRQLAERVTTLERQRTGTVRAFGELWEAFAELDGRVTDTRRKLRRHPRPCHRLRARVARSSMAERLGVLAIVAAAAGAIVAASLGFGEGDH